MKRTETNIPRPQDQEDRRIYRKLGRRYRPVGVWYENYLSDGIWYVRGEGHSMTLLARFDDLPKMPELAVAARMHVQEAVGACAKQFRGKPWSLHDVGIFMADYLAGQIKSKGGEPHR